MKFQFPGLAMVAWILAIGAVGSIFVYPKVREMLGK